VKKKKIIKHKHERASPVFDSNPALIFFYRDPMAPNKLNIHQINLTQSATTPSPINSLLPFSQATMTETNNIDALLERYLLLLDEYTTLQTRLAALHSGVYQNLAKANFSAERGIRYGKDYYDDRMHATRKLVISRGQEDANATSLLEDCPVVFDISSGDEVRVAGAGKEGEVGGGVEADAVDGAADGDEGEGGKREGKSKLKDPLRWFGILTPLPLRQAQKLAVESVEEVVPRLATVSAEMAAVELEVRRARKRRAKAEAAVVKEKLKQQES
jgi:hypothetical protein